MEKINTQRGFIQIPILIAFIVFGAFVTAVGGYYISGQNQRSVEERPRAKIVETDTPAEIKEIELRKQDRKKLDGIVSQMTANKESDENIQFIVNDFKKKYGVSSPSNSEDTKKDDTVAEELMDKMIADLIQLTYVDELDKDIDDFNLILKEVRASKERYISFAENVARQRAVVLDEFLLIVSDVGIRNFVQDLVSDQHKYEVEARNTYEGLFGILEDEIVPYLSEVRNARERVEQNQFTDDIEKLLSKNNQQKERFVNFIPQLRYDRFRSNNCHMVNQRNIKGGRPTIW